MALELRALKKSYGDFSVSLDLSVAEGETLALVGPSGSGKTTVLNLIAGLAEPESGAVIIDGEDMSGVPPWKRNISVVFQDLALFPHLDVGGNIAYGLFIRGVMRKERRRIAEEMLNIVRLPGYASRRVNTLSGGERQRVAIARALASSPRVLLLDEPFSSLDAPLRKALRREFPELRNTRAPCVFVTHDRDEAITLGDRIALMAGGRIAEIASGRDIFFSPKTEAAARFFGAGQVLPCGITEKREGTMEVTTPLGAMTVPLNSEYEPVREPARPLLFIPWDAFLFEVTPRAGLRSLRARCTGFLFEGQKLILKLLAESALLPREEAFAFELNANPRMKPPVAGSLLNFWVDQSMIRFVK